MSIQHHSAKRVSFASVQRVATRLSDPLSHAMLPLANGLMRRLLVRSGAQLCERRINNMSIAYYQAAARSDKATTPVVLVHGIADSAATWAYLMPLLRSLGTVYAIDLPGFGGSSCPAGCSCATLEQLQSVLAAFLETVVGEPALIVGNSLGGWIALKLARRRPELMRGLVVLDPGGAPLNGRSSWQPFVETVAVPDLRTVRLIYRQMFGRVPFPLYLGQRSFQALFSRRSVQEFVAITTEDDFLSADALHNLAVPTALVWGESDRFLPAGSLQFFQATLPQAPTLLLRGCGHLPQQERPLQVARFIRRFVLSIAMAARSSADRSSPGTR